MRCAFVVGIAAVALAGCGGDDDEQDRLSRSEYQAAILDLVHDSAAPTKLFTDLVVGSRPRAKCARMVEKLHDQLNDLIERIAALEPPAQVAGIQADFVTEARRSVDRVGAVQRQVAAGEVSCGRQLNDNLYGMPSSDRAQQAISALEKRGYHVYGR